MTSMCFHETGQQVTLFFLRKKTALSFLKEEMFNQLKQKILEKIDEYFLVLSHDLFQHKLFFFVMQN